VGDEAEIIFGAATDPAMEGEVRVTVIATGFDRAVTSEQPVARPASQLHNAPTTVTPQQPATVIPLASRRTPVSPPPKAAPPVPKSATPLTDVPDMEIPTFIRRQMD
jgi:cell division protein FtsZ